MVVREKDFIRTFILELILVQKESVFHLWDEETITLPNNYMSVLDEIMSDEVKCAKYSDLIPRENRDDWKCNITKELHDFLTSTGVEYRYGDRCLEMKLNNYAISKILYNKRIDQAQRRNISFLAEDFIITKSKTRPKQKTLA